MINYKIYEFLLAYFFIVFILLYFLVFELYIIIWFRNTISFSLYCKCIYKWCAWFNHNGYILLTLGFTFELGKKALKIDSKQNIK
jgi:hypothetical protein